MYFNFDFNIASIILFGIAVLAAALSLLLICPRLRAVSSLRKESDMQPVPEEPMPYVSIILYANDQPQALLRNLPTMLEQEYTGRFDVIIVNDGSSADVNMAVGQLKHRYSNIYLTFTPPGARNLSHHKLAITLGIKAAKADYVLITDADTHVNSKHWLSAMMAPLAKEEADISLGYGYPCEEDATKSISGCTAFDYAADSAPWIYSALKGHPYRGCGFNFAYRKELFFKHSGYAQSINLINGEDDIFIRDISSSARGCAICLSENASVAHDCFNPKRELSELRIAHAFTGRFLPKGPRRIAALSQWLMWIALGCSIAAAVTLGPANGIGWIAFLIVLMGLFIPVGIFWKKASRALFLPCSPWLSTIMAMTRPLRNIKISLKARKNARAHITW